MPHVAIELEDNKQFISNIPRIIKLAVILNNQFQSVFTPKTPLALSKLAQMTVQDLVDAGIINAQSVPAD